MKNNNVALRIGNVESVKGKVVEVKVHKSKNNSHIIYNGGIIKGVVVGSFVKIKKGFDRLIGRIEEEFITEDKAISLKDYKQEKERIKRILRVKLLGYFENEIFNQGIKEFPLIDNEVFLLTIDEFHKIHNFIKKIGNKKDVPLEIGVLSNEDELPISIGVNSLFASHIGIFGNTGSGKSYSLASMYHSLFEKFGKNSSFKKNAKFLLIDFNGEYSGDSITDNKNVIKLSTRKKLEDIKNDEKLPLNEDVIVEVEIVSILANATEKTQKPFIKRAIRKYKLTFSKKNPEQYFKGILRNNFNQILKTVSNKERANDLLDFFYNIVEKEVEKPEDLFREKLMNEISWAKYDKCFLDSKGNRLSNKTIEKLECSKDIEGYIFSENILERLIDFLYIQIIEDLLINRADNKHISPAINKLKSKTKDLQKVINFNSDSTNLFQSSNLVVIDLNDVNLDIKKTIPLLIAHNEYKEQKLKYREEYSSSLNIIIDEAHNILSYNSNRESETWKDYRLEVFEEIIKEGRKFGTFMTIASQRPFDISTTIISQLHNYFLHRLINNKDIEAIDKTVSYLDKVSFDSLSILPTGTCILAGLSAQIPVILKMKELPDKKYAPDSNTIRLTDFWGEFE